MPAYRVSLRHTTLLESATLEARAEDTHFIATAAPPPTHSILTLHSEGTDGEIRYFSVDRCVEVESRDHRAGVVGRLVDAEAHAEAARLGTEHLETGATPVVDTVSPQMPVPAPVVDPDPSSEVASLEAPPADATAEPATDGTPTAPGADPDGPPEPNASTATPADPDGPPEPNAITAPPADPDGPPEPNAISTPPADPDGPPDGTDAPAASVEADRSPD